MILNTTTKKPIVQSVTTEMLFFLEMGNLEGEKGNDQDAIDWYVKGLQLAKSIGDKARTQQFSNLILTYL